LHNDLADRKYDRHACSAYSPKDASSKNDQDEGERQGEVRGQEQG
jgi:hypothetical protein